MASPERIWECVKNNSAFLCMDKNVPTMTAEPGNLTGQNTFNFSGIASKNVFGLDAENVGRKESIVLTTRSKRKGRQQRPGSVLVTTGIEKGKKKRPEQLKKIIASTYDRPELLELALVKYAKIRKSFKKKVALQLVRGRK